MYMFLLFALCYRAQKIGEVVYPYISILDRLYGFFNYIELISDVLFLLFPFSVLFLWFTIMNSSWLMTPACFVDNKPSCLPNRGTDYVCSHTQDSASLLVTQILTTSRRLCSHVAWWNCCKIWCCCHLMHIQMSYINTVELSLSSAVPWLYYFWWYLEICMYTLAHLLLLAPNLTCALILLSLIFGLVKAYFFRTLSLEAYYLKWVIWKSGFTAPIQMCWDVVKKECFEYWY